jgi:hypothetical protein
MTSLPFYPTIYTLQRYNYNIGTLAIFRDLTLSGLHGISALSAYGVNSAASFGQPGVLECICWIATFGKISL